MTDVYSLYQIESELKKRWQYPYYWGKKQNQADDRVSDFIYNILYFEDILTEIERQFKSRDNYDFLFNYALNRWYNFWSGVAIKRVFLQYQMVKVNNNSSDIWADFEIKNIPFDQKTSVFPKNYPQTIDFAQQNPLSLVQWLYENQSQENRQNFKNRIFLILYQNEGQHWQLKAEIAWLANIIEEYLFNFNFNRLLKFQPIPVESLVLTDIIWAIK
jgi:hypothetical protein